MKETNRNKQPQQEQGNAEINKGEQRIGRANQDDVYDISHMDRQEGSMNHGTLGGNFEPAEEREQETPRQGEDRNK